MKIKKVLIALNYNSSAKKIAKVGYLVGKAMDAEIFFYMFYRILCSIILQLMIQ